MREIRFRAWSHNSFIYFSKPEDFKWFFGGFDGPERTLTDCKLNQYTGLKDKNGKEIYEGDILQDEPLYRKREVIFHQRLGYCLRYSESNDLPYECENYEIVGNIYENPELINNAPTHKE